MDCLRLSRRDFLALVPSAALSAAVLAGLPEDILALEYIEPIDPSINPLTTYPNRNWESVYRDIYTPD
ncbi:MAG: twin-arginine translocation signal domain-containing protein, partial [Nitrososphaerota archaeon]